MFFSIIVPVYKVEKYLEACVYSILNQTYSDIELILVDDGSPDNCPTMCDAFKTKDNRVRVIHKENGGLSSARNAGLKAANGEYVLFIDSDDLIKEDACEKFHSLITKNKNVDIWVGLLMNDDGTYYSVKSKAVIGKEYSGIEYFNKFHDSILPCSVASAYRRDFLISSNLFFLEGRYHEDNDFTPRAYLSANKIVYTGIEFYIRFIREDSITQHRDKRKNLKDILFIGHELVCFSNMIDDREAKDHILDYICMAYLSTFYEADIYQYKDLNYGEYVDKRFVRATSRTVRNRIKAVIFSISPRLYLTINKRIKSHVHKYEKDDN